MKSSYSTISYKRLLKLTIGTGLTALLMMSQPSLAASHKHIVNSGETLTGLAKKYNMSVSDIINANGLSATHLQIGQVLDIPDLNVPKTYKVQPGDSLYSVAQKYNITTTELARINNIPTNARLDIADTLILPSSSKASSKTTNSNNVVIVSGDSVQTVKSVENKPVVNTSGTHRIQSGETLLGIARDYGVSLSELARVNNIRNHSHIEVNQVLKIPSTATSKPSRVNNNSNCTCPPTSSSSSSTKAPSTYRVKRGEGLISIANKFQVGHMELAKLNNMSGYEQLRIGQKLKLPARARLRK